MSQDMSADVLDAVRGSVAGRVTRYASERVHREEWDLKGLAAELSVLLMRPMAESNLATDQYQELGEKAAAAGEAAYRAREAQFGAELMRELERHLFLFTLDEHWRDHLYELDHLKGGIGLRAYGQRDPLIEYKKEAFALFETLVNEVNEEFVERLFRVQLDHGATREIERRPAPRAVVAQHAETQTFGNIQTMQQDGTEAARGEGGGAAVAAPARSGPRVGRNDPCPCGSGKKYKKCHMLIDGGGGE